MSLENINLSCIINKTSFIISGERPWIYSYTSVNNKFRHL